MVQFEIKGVPKEVIQEFSKRREEIVAKGKRDRRHRPAGAQDRSSWSTHVTPSSRLRTAPSLARPGLSVQSRLVFDGKALLAEALGRGGVSADRDRPIGVASKIAEILSGVGSAIRQLSAAVLMTLRPRAWRVSCSRQRSCGPNWR